MNEVTKEQFKECYFRLGGGSASGWGTEYWNRFFEPEQQRPMKYFLKEPQTPKHTRMMIVTDHHTNQYRMFFLTEDEEDDFFDTPGKN